MKLFSVLFWLLFATLAAGQTVKVKSGDHPGFTRLVLELPQISDWKLGRTAEGYALHIADEKLRFDVTTVFDDIQRNRLAAIWTDPDTGALRLGIACACHATPFEFRPGIIVIDLADGPPPNGSSFELSLDGGIAGQLAPQTVRPRPRVRPVSLQSAGGASIGTSATKYDWLMQAKTEPGKVLDQGTLLPIAGIAAYTDLNPFKVALLGQLSRGAAQGAVQMVQPNLAKRNSADPLPAGPRANIKIGDLPGFQATTSTNDGHLILQDGADCIPDTKLEVRNWGRDKPFLDQLVESRGELVGEFDTPNTDHVRTAVQLLIHLGFGAEAGQMLAELPIKDDDTGLWSSMAKLVDGTPDPNGAFKDMQTCDTAAALWASLAKPDLKQSDKTNTQAVLRSFSALPAHLRQYLGPILAEKFLAMGDLVTARTISNSTLRGLPEPRANITVMEANIETASGDPSVAASNLAPALKEAGPATSEVLIALVAANLAANEPVDTPTASALAALVAEQNGTPLEPKLQRAYILALASTGDFDQAFERLAAWPAADHDLWALLANSGSDSAILAHAVLAKDTELPKISAQLRSKIASHLLELGMAEAALAWIGPKTQTMPESDLLIGAQASLLLGDSTKGLMWISDAKGDVAAETRAQAYWQLGKLDDAATAWQEAGNSKAELRAQTWARNWPMLAQTDASNWQTAAGLMTGVTLDKTATSKGPLAQGNDLVAESAKTRAALTELLSSVQGP